MQQQRLTEVHVLGYRIDRIVHDSPRSERFEVVSPEGQDALASFSDRPAAENFIVMRELRAIELRPNQPG